MTNMNVGASAPRVGAMVAVLLVLGAQGVGAQAGGQMRKATFTVRWSAETSVSRESLDATIVLELDEGVLPGGEMARLSSRGGGYDLGYWSQPGASSVTPAGGGRLVSVAGTASYSMRLTDREPPCPSNAGVSPGGLPRTETAEGSSTLKAVSFLLRFRGATGDSLDVISVSPEPFTVVTKTVYHCPGVSPKESRSEHRITAAAGAGILGPGETREAWQVDGRRTAGGGYSGTARYHTASETKTLTFSFEWEGGPIRGVGPVGGARPGAAPAAPAGSYKTGQITFTQGGQEAQWELWRAEQQGPGGAQILTLTYTPSGSPGGSHLAVAILRQGGTMTLTGLRVQGGPAGDATYAPRTGGCALQVTADAGGALDGSGTCTSGFRGTPITRFAFRVAP